MVRCSQQDKSFAILFTLTPKQKAGTFTLGGTSLKEDKEVIYLGVTFDKRQTWKPHISTAEAKARRRLAILRKLPGTTHGASEKIMEQFTREQSDPISSMAPQLGQQRQTNRCRTRYTTRHLV